MCPSPELTRLCHLLGEFHHSFPDLVADSLTDENEKALLIALSQVFKRVQQWTNEYYSDEDLMPESLDGSECSGSSVSCLDNHHCLSKIIGDLMLLLCVNSQYVRYLAGNTLVAISQFVLATNSGWDDFMHFVCLCLELAIRNCLPSLSNHGPLETGYIDFDQPTSSSLLKQRVKSADWFVVGAIFQVLRNILKNLKQDFDEKIMKGYLHSVGSLMLNIPWDILTKVYVGQNDEAYRGLTTDVIEIAQPRKLLVLFGNAIQFLCSLVAQSSSSEDGVGFLPVICKIIKLVPKLVAWCHARLKSPHPIRTSHYFRHKVLVLMIKLSSRIYMDQATLTTWIHLLRTYFEDLLLQPISGNKSIKDGSLEGSPFCTSVDDPRKQIMSSGHLQRLTVFLFLKCSLNLVGTKRNPDEHENPQHNLTADMNLNPDCCSGSIGLTELHMWLQLHVPADMVTNSELYFERCVRFNVSFLQLFMHEVCSDSHVFSTVSPCILIQDDILFEMLLHLLRVPFSMKQLVVENEPLAGVKNPVLASDLFNPIHLFHLFLSEIRHDHQVLLDYLISRDTGSSCAEYLLRSLRIICDSWSTFVEFPALVEGLDQLCLKGPKIIVDPINGRNYHGIFRRPFVAATDCLLSLRTSINSLNQKKLFPYNPQVLLQRLVRFQERCDENKL